MNKLTLQFASLLDVLILQCGLQMHTFQVANFRIEGTVSLSRLAKVLELISRCIYILEPKNYAGVFLLKQPNEAKAKRHMSILYFRNS